MSPGWTRFYSWWIAVNLKFLASKALHCTCIIQNTEFFAVSVMDVDHIDTYPASTVVNFQRSGGSGVLAKILGPSERGADNQSITYEHSGTLVMHDCAPMARMSLLRVRTPPRPTPAPSTVNRSERVKYSCRKSGMQCQSLSRAENAPQQAHSRSFCGSYALVFACLAFCHGSLVFPQGGRGTIILAMYLRPGVWDTITRRRVLMKAGG